MTTQQLRRPWVPPIALVCGIVAAVAILLPALAVLALLGVLAVIVVLLMPGIGLPILLASSAVTRVAVPWGDTQIRLELLVVVLLTLVMANRVVVRTLPLRTLISPVLWPLLVYGLLNLVSTLLFATEKTRGLKLDAQIIAAILTYVVVRASLLHFGRIRQFMDTVWIVSVFEAIIGLSLLLAYLGHLTAFGVQLGDFGLPMAYGTSWEANIFGSYLLGNFFLLLGDYLSGTRSPLRLFGLLLILLAIGASQTRTVWIGLVLGLPVLALVLQRGSSRSSGLLPILTGVPIFAVLALVLGSTTPLAGRLLDVVNLHSSSASGRLVIFNAALSDWRQHPLLGSGTGSFNFGAGPGQAHPWLPNLLLLTLHDTGIAGVLALLMIVVVFLRQLIPSMRTTQFPGIVAGAIAAFLALLVAFQTTSGFWFTYPWIVVALAVAAAETHRSQT